MRLFIICTPRTGNTWLRHLLGDLLQAPHKPVMETAQVPWHDLPAKCIYAVHSPRDPDFEAKLAEHNFRVVVPLRHPFDVLISILQNAATNPDWSKDETGAEEFPIHFAMPSSLVFAEFAAGGPARRMLSISPAWSEYPGVTTVRYEDLVADTAGALGATLESLGATTSVSVEDVVARNRMSEMRSRTDQFHCWRGGVETWREFLAPAVAERLSAPYREAYSRFGYSFAADPALDPLTAERNWIARACSEWFVSLRQFQRMQMECRNITKNAEALDAERKVLSTYAHRVTAELEASKEDRRLVGRNLEAVLRHCARLETTQKELAIELRSARHERDAMAKSMGEMGPIGIRAAKAARRVRRLIGRLVRSVAPMARGRAR